MNVIKTIVPLFQSRKKIGCDCRHHDQAHYQSGCYHLDPLRRPPILRPICFDLSSALFSNSKRQNIFKPFSQLHRNPLGKAVVNKELAGER